VQHDYNEGYLNTGKSNQHGAKAAYLRLHQPQCGPECSHFVKAVPYCHSAPRLYIGGLNNKKWNPVHRPSFMRHTALAVMQRLSR
jgi:hypothetical protein